jgi:hypothetical protein
MLEQEFLPLENLWPDLSGLSARFDACLARKDGGNILVKAFLCDRGQAGEELRLMAGLFRSGLKPLQGGAPGGRVLAEFILVSAGKIRQERWEEFAASGEGGFLAPVLLAKACLELEPPNLRRRGRVKPWPRDSWFFQRLQQPSLLTLAEVKGELRLREQKDRAAREKLGKGRPWATWTLIGLNVLAYAATLLIQQSAEVKQLIMRLPGI